MKNQFGIKSDTWKAATKRTAWIHMRLLLKIGARELVDSDSWGKWTEFAGTRELSDKNDAMWNITAVICYFDKCMHRDNDLCVWVWAHVCACVHETEAKKIDTIVLRERCNLCECVPKKLMETKSLSRIYCDCRSVWARWAGEMRTGRAE